MKSFVLDVLRKNVNERLSIINEMSPNGPFIVKKKGKENIPQSPTDWEPLGCVDKFGTLLLPIKYFQLDPLSSTLLYAITVEESSNKEESVFYSGVIDIWGNVIIPFNLENKTFYLEKTIIIECSKSSDVCIYDLRGNQLCKIQRVCSSPKIKLLWDKYLAVPTDRMSVGNCFSLFDLNGNFIHTNNGQVLQYYQSIEEFDNGMLKMRSYSGAFDFLTIDKRLITTPYHEIGPFEEGFAICRKDGFEEGLINDRFETVIPCIYHRLKKVNSNLYQFNFSSWDSEIHMITTDAKIVVNNGEREIMLPSHLVPIGSFQKGVLFVKLDTIDKYGLVDSQGNVIIPVEYTSIMRPTTDLVIAEKKNETQNSRSLALFSIDGKQFTDFKYSKIEKICPDLPFFRVSVSDAEKKNQHYGVIDANGKEVLTPVYESISRLAPNNTVSILGEYGPGIFNFNTLSLSLFPQYADVGVFSEGLYCINVGGEYTELEGCIVNETSSKPKWITGGEWGYINEKFDLVIPFKPYDRAYRFKNGFALVSINEKMGLINKKGELVLDCLFDDINILDDCLLCKLGDQWDKYSLNGTLVESDITTPEESGNVEVVNEPDYTESEQRDMYLGAMEGSLDYESNID